MRKTVIYTAFAFLASLAFAGGSFAAGEYGTSQQGQMTQPGQQNQPPGSQVQQDQMKQTQPGQQQLGGQQGSQATGPQISGMQTGQQQLRAAADIQQFNVQTAAGENLGKVDTVVVDLEQGQIGYVIVSAAAGEDKYIIPWQALRSQPEQQTLVVDMTTELLQQAPKGDIEEVTDREKGREIHQFYGVSPYWESAGTQQGMDAIQHEQMMQQREQMQRQQMQQPGELPRTQPQEQPMTRPQSQ